VGLNSVLSKLRCTYTYAVISNSEEFDDQLGKEKAVSVLIWTILALS